MKKEYCVNVVMFGGPERLACIVSSNSLKKMPCDGLKQNRRFPGEARTISLNPGNMPRVFLSLAKNF